ncbi:hypothetical protein PE143B_0130545 [Pseudomonas extremaustralis 14-3 substr. 14-3b]|nr:hypothetical protein PE143B_0130545 [Pseudomonas extremaustralis 14-3 substr. 14-3b]
MQVPPSKADSDLVREELRALLDAESAPCAKSQVEGKRERFQKWVMATKHPVFGFLDGRSLARGDDCTGYADEYVQGLWFAYLEFGAEQPEPVAVDVLNTGFYTTESGGGKYAINIGFRSMADMQAADAQLRELLKSR